MRSRFGFAVGTAVAVAWLASTAGASSPPYVVQERNLSQDGDWHGGEPQVVQTGRTVVVDWPEVQASGVYRNPATGTFDTAVGTPRHPPSASMSTQDRHAATPACRGGVSTPGSFGAQLLS